MIIIKNNRICYSFALQTKATPRLIHFAQLSLSSLSTGSHTSIRKLVDNPDVFNAPLRALVRYSGHSNRLPLVKQPIVIG